MTRGSLRWGAISPSMSALPLTLAGAFVAAAVAAPPARMVQPPAVPMVPVDAPGEVVPAGPSAAMPPRNTGPQAMAHSRYRRGRHGTTRIIRRTPAVMREDAARVKRGDLFGTWSNQYLE